MLNICIVEKGLADSHARCKHAADGRVEGGTMRLCNVCHGPGHRAGAPLHGTDGRGREVLGKIAPGNYTLGTAQNFTRGTVCEWLITYATFFVLLKLPALTAFPFVQGSGWTCSVFECISAQLSADLG